MCVDCLWENETARERTGHKPKYTEAKKMKLLTLHTHGCLRIKVIVPCNFLKSCVRIKFLLCNILPGLVCMWDNVLEICAKACLKG